MAACCHGCAALRSSTRRTSSCWYRRFTAARSLRDSSDAHFSSLHTAAGLKDIGGGRRSGCGLDTRLPSALLASRPRTHLSVCSQNCASAFSSTLSSSTLQAGGGRRPQLCFQGP